MTRYLVVWKSCMKNPVFYICPLLLAVFLWVQSAIVLPEASNYRIGIVYADALGMQLYEMLSQEEKSLQFEAYPNQMELEKAICAGSIDTGFVFDKQLQENVWAGNLKHVILCLCAPGSSKTEMAKERVYTAFFKVYSTYILQQEESNIYGGCDKNREAYIEKRNTFYLDGTDVFHIETKEIDTKEIETNEVDVNEVDAKKIDEEQKIYPLQGLCGLFLVLISLLYAVGENRSERQAILKCMTPANRISYGLLSQFTCMTGISVVSLVCILSSKQSRGVGKELLAWLLLATWCALLHTLLYIVQQNDRKALLHDRRYKQTEILVLLLFYVLLCPIYFDLAVYVPVIAWIRKALPLGAYLCLFN